MDAIGITIVIDTREQRPLLFSDRVQTVRATVPSGADYTVLGHESEIGIERKSLDDLVGSLTANRARFARSLVKLRERQWRLILIEAPLTAMLAGWYHSKVNPSALLGSVCGIMTDGIPVCFADDATHAAQLAERWLVKAATRAGAVQWKTRT